MRKIDSRPGNRVVLLTVCMVALAGLLVSAAFYIRTQTLVTSYDNAMETELQQKGLAYGQTAQSLLSLVAASSPQAFASFLSETLNNPGGILTQFDANRQGKFQDAPLSFEVWTQNPSALGGYALLFRRDLAGGRSIAAEDARILPLVTQTAATSRPATNVDANAKDLHYSFLIQANGQTSLIVVATLDASEEFAFINAQRQHAIRGAIILAAGSIVFLIVVGGGLSFLVSRTLTNRKQMEETLREQARHDQLTGVLNHATIVEELQRVIASGPHERCAVAMIDVDGMKALNDTYGHLIGDQALQAVARVLDRDGAVVGRYGGDEFTAVLPGAERDDAEHYRREILAALAQTKLNDPDTRAQVPLAATIGFAVYPEEAETIVDLIKLADSAMYAQRRQRPIAPDSQPRRSPADDRAARMVGEIVPLLTSPGNIRAKLRFVAHRLLLGLGCDAVTAVLYAPKPGGPALSSTVARLDQALVQAWDDDQGQEGIASILRALLQQVQRPFIINDLPHDERLSPSQRELLARAGILSGLVVPMIWQGQTLGALAIGSRQAVAFGPADAQLVNAVAGQVTAIVRMSSVVEELQITSAQLTNAQEETVLLLAAAAEAHDGATGRHLQRVQALVETLARELGQPEEEARALGTAAVLHDIGKLFVPETVLASAGPLDDAGWELMKRHTTLGQQFLNGHTGFELAATIARHHHERWDGTGYPDGLAGMEIPAVATIVTVADAFDAMTSGRPYRGPLSLESAIAEISACSGTQFSPRVVEALLRLHEQHELPMVEGEARRAA